MAQLMKRTLVFGMGAIGLTSLIQGASADTESKSMTLAEVKAENAKRIAAYESEKREIDERNRVKRAQYRDAYAHYAEFSNRGEAEPKAPEYEALPTLELLDEPIELPFDVAGATPHESTFMSEHNNNVAIPESSSSTASESDKTKGDTPSDTVVAESHETTEKSGTLSNATISEFNDTTNKESEINNNETKETGAKEGVSDATTSETKGTGEKTSSDVTTSETKETGEKTSSDVTTSETKETGEKTSSDSVAAQLNGEKTSSDSVAAQLNKESEKTTTSSSDAAAQVSKIESEKASTTTKSDTPTETTSSTDASTQVAKLEAEKLTTTKSEEVTPAANTTKSDANQKKTDEVEKTNTNTQARNLSNTPAKSSKSESTTKDKAQESLPHTGDSGSIASLMGVAMSGLGVASLRRKRK